MKNFNQKLFSATVSMLMTVTICQVATTQASDIDIYRPATTGQTRIMFVLDTSASMRSDFNNMGCDAPSGSTISSRGNSTSVTAATVNGISIPAYTRYTCKIRQTLTSPKTYKYKQQVVSQTTAAVPATPSVTTYKRCGTTNSATVTSTGSCTNSGTLTGNSIPSSGYCPLSPPTRSGNITTTYYYDRNGCGGATGTARYRYRIEVTDSVPEIPASTVPTNNCTPTGSVTCNYEYSSCPANATTLGVCTIAITSPPSGSFSNESCGTGCTSYFNNAVTSTVDKDIYDRITKLKEGMMDVLIGRNSVTRLDDGVAIGLTTFAGVLVRTRRLDATYANLTGVDKTNFSSECGTTPSITQRSCLVAKVANLANDTYTPTGIAYAKAAKSLVDTIGTDTSVCNGNGIYTLTDGGPSSGSSYNPETEMKKLDSSFACPALWSVDTTNTNPTFQYKPAAQGVVYDNQNVWRCIAKFSDTLLKGTNSRAKIKTATVGFGSFYEGLNEYTNAERDKTPGTPLAADNIDIQNILNRYNDITNTWAGTQGGSSRADIANTALWGVYGRGGWYAASEPAQVADSILKFVDTVKPTFDPIVTGSPTIPVDALNPIQLQPYGYYATFVPKPQDNMQLWLGNLNKYHIYNGELYDNDKLIQLIQENGLINSAASGIWGAAGMLGQLPLGTFTDPDKNTKSANRVVFTNREMSGTSAMESNSLQQVTLETLFDVNAEKAKFKNDPDKRYWLNILGYQIDATTDISSMTLDTLPTAQQRQMGAVMHSKPILLTQEGKVIATKVSGSTTPTITTTGREDYLLFGSNQGMLHVVDIISGKEKFAFVPHEMMNNQKLGFLSEGNTDLGKDHLYYGIDGAWTAYTQYVSKTDGTLTVKSSDRKDYDGNDLNQAGLQWVYGGLRMGGRGYYGLDLSNINAPSLKFHINPMGTGSAEDPTGYMGKSWSKPTIAWVNWGGTRKLVMFVGGGYDDNGEVQCGDSSDATSNPNLSTYDSLNKYNNKGYECPKYNQTNQKGAGVYMFDAGDGSLLWWGSANAASTTSATTNSGVIATKADDLKYSVVSQINAVDRNSDGLVDHLFFGDLGGQAFRVDLNNNATTTGAFAKRVVPLYKGHLANGLSPRFYEMPSFSVHGGGVNGLFGVVALSSGNRSSPLAGTNTVKVAGVDQIVTTPTANDGVYVIYDNDVARTDLYSEITLRTSNVSLPAVTFGQLKAGITQTSGSGVSLAYRGGWNYKFSAEAAGKYKGMNEIYALDGMLYVNVYNKDGTGVTGSCGAGVIGNSELYQFCLPTGRCSFYDNNTSVPNSSVLGVGIIGTGLGQGYSNKGNETGLIIKKDTANHCDNVANKNKPECQLFDNSSKLKQMRWYETQ